MLMRARERVRPEFVRGMPESNKDYCSRAARWLIEAERGGRWNVPAPKSGC